MPQDQKRRQQSLQRKAAKRKQKRHAVALLPPDRMAERAETREMLTRAQSWPLYECLISRDWQSPDNLAQVLVSRRSPVGQIAAGMFLVDLGCLGVKNAYASLLANQREYERRLRISLMESERMISADLNLAAKIVTEGLAYARSLGFNPDPDYRMASIMLLGADPAACAVEIPVGKDGKPWFVSGPHDNPRAIIAQLTKAVGPGNFDYMVRIDSPSVLPEYLEIDPRARVIETGPDDGPSPPRIT